MQGKNLRKAIIQGTLMALIFLASWFVLSQINWKQLLKIEDSTRDTGKTRVAAQYYSILQR